MEEQRNRLLLLAWATCFLLACLFAGCAGDVPDGVVYTDLYKTVKKGDSVTLKCEFRGEPIAVYWKKEIGKGQWTDLITWVEGTMRSGSCSADDSCEMNQDYSLIINHVQIADRGRYMCKISNYLGILIDNYTDVNTYAPPEEPYPFIEECPLAENQPSSLRCSVPTKNTSLIITCSASSFFPDLNLFFLHGSIKISNTGSDEWTNKDGTKNISIWIKGSASEKPYVCVASDIPGSTDERTATVFVQTVSTPSAPDRSSYPSQTTVASVGRTDEADGARPAKIVVPVVIIITLAGGTMLIVYCWLKRRRRAPASGEKDVEETKPMLQTIKVHVEGMVSYYELWSLAYNTPKEDMGKVCTALRKLGMEISNEQTRSKHVYKALCQWKRTTKPKEQAQQFRDALEDAELENRWHQIYGERRQGTTKVSEGILEQILLDLESSRKIKKFSHKLISKGEITVDITKEKDADVPNTDLNRDNTEEMKKMVSDPKSNADGEDDESDDVSDAENYDEVSDAEKKEDVVQEAARKLNEWNKGPFTENPYVLLSLALERAGCTHVSRTIFDGIVSFYELRSLLYNMETPDMKKLRNLIKELGEIEDVKAGLGPQQIYEALCQWKEKHNKGDQAKLLRDALEKADLSEAWLKIPETRENTARLSERTFKHILLEIGDPIKIQQFISKLVPGAVRHQSASGDKDVIQQAFDTLTKWSKGQFVENPMILLSRALERSGCQPVDRTFFYGTISYFELWSLVHAYEDDMKTLCDVLRALGIQDVHNTKTLNRGYVLLSEWKNRHHACDQLLALKMLLVKAELLKLFEDLHERRNRTDAKVSDDTLEHILWHVTQPNKINEFVLELIQNLRESGLDVSKPARDFKAALEELKQWSKGPFDENPIGNPIVQLSLALERAKCTPVDRTFFKVPIQLQKPIKNAEVKVFVDKLTRRHCKRLAHSLSKTDEQRVSEILDENNGVLFDTKRMIGDWIANVECSNYERRCRLDDAVIKIGRHDMTDPFGTIAYRRGTEEHLKQLPHRRSECFNHDTVFDDDLISLAKLMSCLDAGIISEFCTNVGISDQEKEAFKHCPVAEVLRNWRDSSLTSKSANGSLESVFSRITELMGDKTYVKYVIDEELGFIGTQLEAVGKIDKLLSNLHIHRDKKKGKRIVKQKDPNQKGNIAVSERQEEEIGNMDKGSVTVKEQSEGKGKQGGAKGEQDGAKWEQEGAEGRQDGAKGEQEGAEGSQDGAKGEQEGKQGGAEGKQGGAEGEQGGAEGEQGGTEGEQDRAEGEQNGAEGEQNGAEREQDGAEGVQDGAEGEQNGAEGEQKEVETSVRNNKDSEMKSVFVGLLKEWRKHSGEKSSRKKLRTVLKTMGMEECIVNKTPRKYMYKAELVQVAFNILMTDVFPVIEALEIDRKKARKYRRQNPDPKKGSLCLLIQICQGTKQLEAYPRHDFLSFLLKLGYIGAAKSLYSDYEMSLCEMSSIVSSLHKDKLPSFINQLGISSDELTECIGADQKGYHIEVMRIWKSKIHPVPYHYRMHIITALQAIECWDLAGEVLSGHHRGATVTDDVIRAICGRLDGEQIKRLCDLLKLKPEKQKSSTSTVVRWVNNWMKEYDPFPKVVFKGKSLDKFQPRKHTNNELVKAGFYELANEIMMLEFSRF